MMICGEGVEALLCLLLVFLPHPLLQITALLSKPQELDLASSSGGLSQAWFTTFRLHQAHEVWVWPGWQQQ